MTGTVRCAYVDPCVVTVVVHLYDLLWEKKSSLDC
jgi:hypothetical protein